jgi:AhpD family alkylhydroperoxidase
MPREEAAMNEIEAIVPGFTTALESGPVTMAAHLKLARALEESQLPAQARARIGLAIAQLLRCEYCVWVHSLLAEGVGLTAEDIFFVRAGTALDPRDAAIVKLACRVVAGGVFQNRIECDEATARCIGKAEVSDVVTQVAFAVVNCYVLQSLAPAARETRPAAR